MNALLLIICHQFRTRVVGVQLYLVDGRHDLAGGVAEEFLKVFDAEIGHANVADFASSGEFLHFLPRVWLAEVEKKMEGGVKRKYLPCFDEVPVW